MLQSESTENLTHQNSQFEQEKIAEAFLNNHAEELKKKFSTSEDLESLFTDVFGNNLTSSEDLANLRDKFADGTLHPKVKFVSPQVLTDAQGRTRHAAFDQESQTILLSESLDAAGIKSSIEQELGHWWDVQLNGTKDSTAKGKPFDEGTAYAERFAEGTKGNNVFSDVVYQSDFHTVLLNGREASVEFRPIATWNINGNTNSGNNTWDAVFDVMENPGQGQAPIEIMGIQEAGRTGILGTLQGVTGATVQQGPNFGNIASFDLERNDVPYRVYWTGSGIGELGLALVLKNPSNDASPIFFQNPTNPNLRGILGVDTGEKYYFTVHAQSGSGLNVNNDAEALLTAINNNQNLNPDQPRYILGDFNRNVATADNPVGNVNTAFPAFNQQFAPPNAETFSARTGAPNATLDYLFTPETLQNPQGTVLNQRTNAGTNQFPSDHFPVVYDDTIQEPGTGTVTPNPNVTSTFFTPDTTQETGVRELNPASDINPTLPTYILTHGFTDGVNSGTQWQKKMGNTIFQQQNANIILVDWNAPGIDPNISFSNLTGLSLTDYEQSASNTQVIGDRIAKLVRDSNINPANTTLIGHSLGAQVSGWAGQKFQELQPGAKISNIVGLDPARPGFQESLNSEFYTNLLPVNIFGNGILGNYVSPEQLDATDANRVSAIHTSQRFGITTPITGAANTENTNALDIYINGGSYLGTFSDPIGTTSHNYSHEFFQYLLEGEGFNQERNQVTGSKLLSNLKNPLGVGNEEIPLVSLNTILQGNGTPGDINQDIVDIKIEGLERSEQVAQIPDGLFFAGTNSNDTLAGTNKSDRVDGGKRGDILSGLSGNDTLFGNNGNDLMSGGTGNDTLDGDEGNDRVFGNTGNDSLFGDNGNDIVAGGNGDDFLLEGNNGNDTVAGEEGNDFLNGNNGNDSLSGDNGNDSLSGNSGNDILFGGNGNDTLFGDVLFKDNGNDSLVGGTGNDNMDGGTGNDTLNGVQPGTFGSGEVDTLSGGGGGNDIWVLGESGGTFYSSNGNADYALIEDFNNTDKIQIGVPISEISLTEVSAGSGFPSSALGGTSIAVNGDIIGLIENVAPNLVPLEIFVTA